MKNFGRNIVGYLILKNWVIYMNQELSRSGNQLLGGRQDRSPTMG
jgi:hypothetical protein